MSTENIVRRRFVFHGSVQGVGFRATVCELARPLAVIGFVRNLPDGTVEAEVEGLPSEIERLLDDIQATFSRNITDRENTEIPTTGVETGFSIAR